jgi:hypothetical protein
MHHRQETIQAKAVNDQGPGAKADEAATAPRKEHRDAAVGDLKASLDKLKIANQ